MLETTRETFVSVCKKAKSIEDVAYAYIVDLDDIIDFIKSEFSDKRHDGKAVRDIFFVHCWNVSSSPYNASQRYDISDLTEESSSVKTSLLRKKGYKLKKFKGGVRLGSTRDLW